MLFRTIILLIMNEFIYLNNLILTPRLRSMYYTLYYLSQYPQIQLWSRFQNEFDNDTNKGPDDGQSGEKGKNILLQINSSNPGCGILIFHLIVHVVQPFVRKKWLNRLLSSSTKYSNRAHQTKFQLVQGICFKTLLLQSITRKTARTAENPARQQKSLWWHSYYGDNKLLANICILYNSPTEVSRAVQSAGELHVTVSEHDRVITRLMSPSPAIRGRQRKTWGLLPPRKSDFSWYRGPRVTLKTLAPPYRHALILLRSSVYRTSLLTVRVLFTG